jgi:hypothetical protein
MVRDEPVRRSAQGRVSSSNATRDWRGNWPAAELATNNTRTAFGLSGTFSSKCLTRSSFIPTLAITQSCHYARHARAFAFLRFCGSAEGRHSAFQAVAAGFDSPVPLHLTGVAHVTSKRIAVALAALLLASSSQAQKACPPSTSWTLVTRNGTQLVQGELSLHIASRTVTITAPECVFTGGFE